MKNRKNHVKSVFLKAEIIFSVLYFTGVTILLSLTVLQNFVQDTLPQVSDAMPLLGTIG